MKKTKRYYMIGLIYSWETAFKGRVEFPDSSCGFVPVYTNKRKAERENPDASIIILGTIPNSLKVHNAR